MHLGERWEGDGIQFETKIIAPNTFSVVVCLFACFLFLFYYYY